MKQTNTQQDQSVNSNVVNGVDLDVLGTTISTIQSDPGMGTCHFRVSNNWIDGAYNRSSVTGFYGARQEIAHKQTFQLLADEPSILAGEDKGANPVEHLLHALASCLTTSMVAHAAVRGIKIDSMQAELEGDIDLNGFLGLSRETPKGFTNIRANFRVEADEKDMATIESLASFSPVFNTLANGVNVEVSVSTQ